MIRDYYRASAFKLPLFACGGFNVQQHSLLITCDCADGLYCRSMFTNKRPSTVWPCLVLHCAEWLHEAGNIQYYFGGE